MSNALSWSSWLSAGGSTTSVTSWTPAAASSRAISVSLAESKVASRGARISRSATWPASRFSWPSVMLADRIRKSAAATTAATATARHTVALAPRPVSLRVRGMNTRRLTGQEPADDVAHQPSVGAALGPGRQPAHDPPEVSGRGGAGLGDRIARQPLDVGLGQLLREELGEDGGLGLLGRRPVLVAGVAVHRDALATLLDLPAEDVDDLLVGEVTPALDAQVLGSRHRHPQRLRPLLVAGAHRVTHGGLDPCGQGHGGIGIRRHRSEMLLQCAGYRWVEAGVWLGARGCLSLLGFLALSLHAGLLVVLAASCLSQDSRLLDLLVESTQRALEGLVLAHADFCQTSRLLSAHVFVPTVGGSAARHASPRRVPATPIRVNRAPFTRRPSPAPRCRASATPARARRPRGRPGARGPMQAAPRGSPA